MEKKTYMTPETERVYSSSEELMITASPGIGGDYDPSLPIDAKEGLTDDSENFLRIRNLWDD